MGDLDGDGVIDLAVGAKGDSDGGTYRGAEGEVCGGDTNWGATDVEVWVLRAGCASDADCGLHGSCGGGGACACESARYGGVLCEVDCGEHGTADGNHCVCESARYGGHRCEVDCGAHGSSKPDGSCEPANFRGSRLLAVEWGGKLNGWAGKGEGQEWSLCCSTFEGCDTAAKFHAACDAHTPTLTVAHNAGGTSDCPSWQYDCTGYGSNPGNFTFGGFVRSSPLACGLRS